MNVNFGALGIGGMLPQPYSEARVCGCVGPQNGDPVCPCRMPAHLEREAGRKALELLRQVGKPRVRVPAISRHIEGNGG